MRAVTNKETKTMKPITATKLIAPATIPALARAMSENTRQYLFKLVFLLQFEWNMV